ncbi:MAG: hypothetical protein KAJ66_06975 [Candidatus Omnitrophica bacterium]|nr:hypothetical protein [Candidatus Omnitrophota bacterium]
MIVLSPRLIFAESEYSFDLDEIEKKAYSLGGYIETRPVFLVFDKDSALYKLKLYNQDEGKTSEEYNVTLQLEGSYEKGIAKLYTKINADLRQSYLGWSDTTSVLEGYLSLKPSSSFTINAGKKALKWGKGYAWTPAAFADRTKNPDDPDLSLEGFIGLSADYIKSYSGPLKTISFTPVLIPVYDDVNNDFGETDHVNFAGKLYLLLYDTDIDFIILTGGSKTTRFGFDFSRNITSNLEIHGEFAFINNFGKKIVNNTGNTFVNKHDAKSGLFGVRYLTESDTTFIVEYYHNGTGFTDGEMEDYFSFINTAYEVYTSSGNDNDLQKALNLTEGNYGKMNPMRNYLYARVSQKEPFDILYFTPAITGILNINDGSFSISPEIMYTGITNLELRFKTGFLIGQSNSEYGEKLNNCRAEFRMRYYF